MGNRAEKWMSKYHEDMKCFNEAFYGDGQCFKSPALDDYSVSIPNITKEDCSTTCQVLQTEFYGVEDGQKCYCGNIPKSDVPGTCNVACQGDRFELDCGGIDSTLVTTVKGQGNCFSNKFQVLPVPPQSVPALTHSKCSEICSLQGYSFYGLQDTNCLCGNYLRSAQPGNCDIACAGDLTENCGGNDAVLVLPVEEQVPSAEILCDPCTAAKIAQKAACIFGENGICKAAHKACDIACLLCGGCPEP